MNGLYATVSQPFLTIDLAKDTAPQTSLSAFYSQFGFDSNTHAFSAHAPAARALFMCSVYILKTRATSVEDGRVFAASRTI